MKRLAFLLFLSGLARAEVTVYSACPGEMTLKCGDKDISVGSMGTTSLNASEVTVLNDQGTQVCKGNLQDRRFYVLAPNKNGQAALLDAGASQDGGKEPLKAIGFYNSLSYPVILEMYAISGDDNLTDVKVGPNEVVGPYELPAATFKVFVKDEGLNPLGTSYNNVKPGQFYLLYHKHDALYDVERLGTILPKSR
ncbi:hypothetical protein JST97_20725 [bacterium]|nr:hypothetical protein [bacterium]